jgi:3-oxoacyl-[acyl-carrier-protein] synthase II
MIPRVVVTGIGAVSSAGPDADALADAVAAGRSCLRPISDPRYRPSHRTLAGLVAGVPRVLAEFPAGQPAPDRFVLLALAAAAEALRRSGLPLAARARTGAVVGTCSGPAASIEARYAALLAGQTVFDQAETDTLAYAAAARALARAFGLRGFLGTVATACSAGATAIGTGLDLLRSGLLDAVLAGGTDATSLSTQLGFDGLKATCDGACAPFSKPVGLCLGEGAAFLVLERLDSARARGAAILAEILGFGASNDAHHCSAPDPSGQGQALAILRALRHAGLTPDRIGYINAHGTGTPANDKAETRAIRKVFGPLADRIPVSSQKAVFGHTLGAAGALETTGAILCRQRGALPPTARFSEPREGCTLDYVPEPGRPWPDTPAWLKENFAFGGHNACLVLGPTPEPGAPAALKPGLARVCLTGVGLVTPAGAGPNAFRQILNQTSPAWSHVSRPGQPTIPAALAPDAFDPALERRLGLSRMDKASALATLAAHLALSDSGLAPRPAAAEAIGLFLALASGSNWAESAYMRPLLANGYALQSVADFPFVVPNSTAGTVCRALGLKGHHAAFCFGPGAGLAGLLAAACAVANRHAEVLLAGSVDVLTPRADTHPILHGPPPPAEGAIFFVLEPEDLVMARGAPILARVDAMAADADTAQAAGQALDHAGLRPADLAAICGPSPFPNQPDIPTLDISDRLGLAEASQPLFNLAAALLSPAAKPQDSGFRVQGSGGTSPSPTRPSGLNPEPCLLPPLLALIPARQDHAVALVLRPVPRSVSRDPAESPGHRSAPCGA